MTRTRSRTTVELALLAWTIPAALGLLAVPFVAITVAVVLSGTPPAGLIPGFVAIRMLAAAAGTAPRRRVASDADRPPVVAVPAGALPEIEDAVARSARTAGYHGAIAFELEQSPVIAAALESAGTLLVTIGAAQLALLDPPTLELLVRREVRLACSDPHRRTAAERALGAVRLADARLEWWISPLQRPLRALAASTGERVGRLARAAELALDGELAAQVGAGVLAEAIAAHATVASLAGPYWYREVQAVLEAGFLPPFAAGLRTFAGNVIADAGPQDIVQGALGDQQGGVLEPAPLQRIERLGTPEPDAVIARLRVAEERSAVDAPQEMNAELLRATAARAALAAAPASWSQALRGRFDRDLLALVAEHRTWLDGVELDSVPTALAALDTEADDPRANALLALLALTMLADGWSLQGEPGAPFLLCRGEETTWPFAIGQALRLREASREDFADWCSACGVERLLAVDDVIDDESTAASTPLPEPLRGASIAAPAPLDAIPAGERIAQASVRLWSSRSERVVGAVGLTVVLLLAVPILVLCLSRVFATDAGHSVGARTPYAVISVLIAATLGWVVRAGRRSFLARPMLAVDASGGLTIVHPALLRTPLTLPPDALLAADVDTSESGERFAVHETRAPLTPAGRPVVGFLWDRTRGSLLPVLDVDPGAPNVAIVLRRAVEAPPPVRGGRLHSTLKGERIDALLLRSEDPQAARALLAGAGLLRPLTAQDLDAASAVS